MTSGGERALWDARYQSSELVWGATPNRFVAEHTGELSARRVLDLGCGEGRNAVWLAQQGHTVTGLDISPVAIERARDIAEAAGVDVEFRIADLVTWHPGETWDLVLIVYLHLLPDRREAVWKAAADAIVPGGSVFVVGHHLANLCDGTGGPQDPTVLLTEAMLLAGFSDLEVDQCETVRRPVATETGTVDAIDVVMSATRPHSG